ncbi:hypothetical protein [Lysobacter enzymogenes]|uniref:hypothetical protein n=1 Tax=Lysobacter enzymogenes TaxID=69 RepID=UPI001A96881A|nr:hypothetical protein [Lysobacter enzymogenes]QQP98415.1 hypothetical protein JHW38_10730 [Lysobacter enzymogenes]
MNLFRYFRARRACLLAFALAVAGAPALAGSSGSATIHSSQGSLELHSSGNGVYVAVSKPSSYWSYASGDQIASVAGRPVRTPEDIFSILRATSASTVDSVVSRSGTTLSVTLKVYNYRSSMPPAPPPPPPPPGA